MLIGELVERTGLTKDTIRFYEKKGLISLDKSRRENNYKEYSEGVFKKLMLIRRLKDLGFTLQEIHLFLELWRREHASCGNMKYTLVDKIAFVDEQLQKLFALKNSLTESLNTCNAGKCEFEKVAGHV